MSVRSYPLLMAVLSFGISNLAACDASSGGPLQLPGFSFDFGGGHKNDQPESQTAEPPQEVAGAFLTCAFMDDQETVAAKGRDGSNVELGCGLYKRSFDTPKKKKKPELTNIAGLQSKTGVSCIKRKTVRIVSTKTPEIKELQTQFEIQTAELPCQVQMRVWDSSGRRALFVKSIPTVTQAGAKDGFDIENDMENQELSYAEEQASGNAPSGISTRAPNSTLGNWLAAEIGGSVGDDLSKANNQNFNGGRLIGVKPEYDFIPSLNSKSVSSGGVVLSSSGYGVGSSSSSSSQTSASTTTTITTSSDSNYDALTPEEKRKLMQQKLAKQILLSKGKMDGGSCVPSSSNQTTPPSATGQGADAPAASDVTCSSATGSTPKPGSPLDKSKTPPGGPSHSGSTLPKN